MTSDSHKNSSRPARRFADWRLVPCALAIGLALLCQPVAASAETPAAVSPGTPVATDELPEEIIVEGTPRGTLRDELYRAEEQVFAIFNDLNSDDEYDIHCERRLASLSHIWIRVCEPRFVSDLTSQAAYAAFMKRPVPAFEATMFRKRALLLEEMRALARKYPELLEALAELGEATDAVEGRNAPASGSDSE